MTARKFWTQCHWLLGITAGSLLLLIGLSGAVLAFREEVLDLLNPGGRHVAARAAPTATPDAFLRALSVQLPHERVGTLALYAEPGRAARAILEPRRGERRGDTVYLNPYDGELLPALQGAAFFEFAESLHRWLLLPREPGRIAAGVLAIGLLLLSLSGLYLRWPRDWRQVAAWWHVDRRLDGRALWRRLHLVAGTACLVMYVALTATGLFWSFDAVRDPVSAWLGEPRTPRATAPRPTAVTSSDTSDTSTPKRAPALASVDVAWRAFERAAQPGGWSEAIVRVPTSAKASILFTWMDTAPAHERARNRMTVRAETGEIAKDERHAAKPLGARALAAVYPLHMGSLFGLPGRIVMFLAALMLPAFTVTGWWLYLGRRKLARQAAAKRLARAA
ncbi:hypothetical protein CDN99_08100 [Roseateles aquatilis]|uniref:PepSY domain-containing protein n=1 Tax=Roseateles aquatilis TaxID=431061 RepID=A0A246JI86_9BURK|nr:PepSY-associated TM helix domain-containing protein [Roseateles aquatilis]OWQ92285.1 hypothetical protein CDN99_08100 [Roseateles aquatilis]